MTTSELLAALYQSFDTWLGLSRTSYEAGREIVFEFLPEHYLEAKRSEELAPDVWQMRQLKDYFERGGQNPDDVDKFHAQVNLVEEFVVVIIT